MTRQRVHGPSSQPVLDPPGQRVSPVKFPGFGQQPVEAVPIGNPTSFSVRPFTAADVSKCLLIYNQGPVVLQIPDVDVTIPVNSIIDLVAMSPGPPAPTVVQVRGAGVEYTQYLQFRAQFSRGRLQKVYAAGQTIEGRTYTTDLWALSGDLAQG